MSEKTLIFFLLILLSCCSNPSRIAYDKIDFTFSQIDSIKLIQTHFDSIFMKFKGNTYMPISHYGFTAYDSNDYYYFHCLLEGTLKYAKPENCNLESTLSKEEIILSEQFIKYLHSIGIQGSAYNNAIQTHSFGIDVDYQRYGDSREILLLGRLDTTFVKKTVFEILDIKNGLVLLKERDYVTQP